MKSEDIPSEIIELQHKVRILESDRTWIIMWLVILSVLAIVSSQILYTMNMSETPRTDTNLKTFETQ